MKNGAKTRQWVYMADKHDGVNIQNGVRKDHTAWHISIFDTNIDSYQAYADLYEGL